MATKCPGSPLVKNIKKNRKTITLSTKIDVIKRFESGELAVEIANHYCLIPTIPSELSKAMLKKLRQVSKIHQLLVQIKLIEPAII